MDFATINSTEKKTKFVISLDAIDLNLIPATFNRCSGTEVTQLWTKSNLDLRSHEFYDFEIKQEKKPNENCPQNIPEYVPCHACNIEVPKPYLKDHFKSNKHITYKKIIDISLNRLKSFMNNMEVFEELDTSDLVYFCPSCVSTIDIKDKGLHEKTMIHKNSLIVDKILNDFLDLYESNDKTLKDKTEIDIDDQMKNIIEDKQTEIVDKNNILKENSINCFEKSLKVESDNNVPVPLNEITSKNIETISINETLQDYVQFLNDKYNYNAIKTLNGSNLIMNTIYGKKIKVFEMNFHGLVKSGNKSYHCELCLKHISKKEKWYHLYQKEHVDRVTVALKNENTIRVIDPIWSHCVICNERIQFESEHISSKNHKLRIDQLKIPDLETKFHTLTNNLNTKQESTNIASLEKNQSINNVKENSTIKSIERNDIVQRYFCDICEIDVVGEGYKKHLETLRHKIEVTIKKSKIHYLMKYQSNKKLICVICTEPVVNTEPHLKSVGHINNYNHQLLINKIKDVQKYRFYCKLCNVSFIKTKEWIHVQDKQHKDNFIKTVIDKANTQIDIVSLRRGDIIVDNSFRCTICNINVPNHNYNIYTHLTCAIHKTAINSLDTAEILNIHYHVDLASLPLINCMVCDVQLPLNEKNGMAHIKGNIHVKRYNILLINNQIIKNCDDYLCKICSVNIPHLGEIIHCKTKKHITNLNLANANKSSIHDTIEGMSSPTNEIALESKMYLLKEFGSLHEVYCIACDVRVPIGLSSAVTHLKGRQHNNNYEKTLKDNYIENLCDDFKCTQCNVIVVTGKEFDHIASRKHQDTLVDLTKHYCFICNTKLSNNEENISNHIVGAKHTQMLVMASQHNIQINEDHCYCDTCDKVLKNESVLEHKSNLEHHRCEFIEGK